MKKLTSLFVILALLMLCACGSKTGSAADGIAAPDSSDIPEVCRVYEDYVLMEAIAPQNSRLPLASDAARGGIFAQTANKVLVNNPCRKQETCL